MANGSSVLGVSDIRYSKKLLRQLLVGEALGVQLMFKPAGVYLPSVVRQGMVMVKPNFA